jgi:hypothetical protein
LPVGEGNDFQQAPEAHDRSQGESAQGETFENSSPVNFFGHLPFDSKLKPLHFFDYT